MQSYVIGRQLNNHTDIATHGNLLFSYKCNSQPFKTIKKTFWLNLKGRAQCFSKQVVTKQVFSPQSWKKNWRRSACRFWEKRKKRTFISENWRHRSES